MSDIKKEKYDFLHLLLGQGDAMVCLDARNSMVDVPKSHKNNPILNLIFNLNFRRPIEIDEEGIYATLSFAGRPHKCIIPFEAIWAIYEPSTQKGQVWEESVPQDIDLIEHLQKTKQTTQTTPKAAQTSPKTTESSGASNKPKRDRSHLRVIK